MRDVSRRGFLPSTAMASLLERLYNLRGRHEPQAEVLRIRLVLAQSGSKNRQAWKPRRLLLTLWTARPINRVLGMTRINVATRVMALIVAAVGITFIVTGLKKQFPRTASLTHCPVTRARPGPSVGSLPRRSRARRPNQPTAVRGLFVVAQLLDSCWVARVLPTGSAKTQRFVP